MNGMSTYKVSSPIDISFEKKYIENNNSLKYWKIKSFGNDIILINKKGSVTLECENEKCTIKSINTYDFTSAEQILLDLREYFNIVIPKIYQKRIKIKLLE